MMPDRIIILPPAILSTMSSTGSPAICKFIGVKLRAEAEPIINITNATSITALTFVMPNSSAKAETTTFNPASVEVNAAAKNKTKKNNAKEPSR